VKRTQTAAVKLVPLAQLKAHPRNPRRHDRGEIDALKASILEYGFTEPLIRQQSSGYVVAGAGRLQAASELAEEGKLARVEFTPGVRLGGCLPVVDKRLTDRQALAYLLADNQLTIRGSWDFPEVQGLLVELRATDFDLTLTGFGQDILDPLMAGTFTPGDFGDESDTGVRAGHVVHFSPDLWATVVLAVNKVRKDRQDMAESKALELICADYLSGS